MSSEIINGSRTSFGPRESETKLACAVHSAGVKKQILVPVKYDDLPSHTEGDVTGAALPANALITGVYSTPATTTFAGGTSYALNLVEDDGTAVSSPVATFALADMNTGVSETISDSTVGANGPAYVEVVATGTFTAGEGAMVIEYIEQIDLF